MKESSTEKIILLDDQEIVRNKYILMMNAFLITLAFGLIMPLIPFYAIDLGATAFQIGIMASAFMLMRAFFSPFFGQMSDKIGRKTWIVSGALIYAILSVMFAYSSSIIELTIIRAMQGVVSAMVWPVAEALLVDSVGIEKRGSALGSYMMATMGGFILGPAAGGIIIHFSLTYGLDKIQAYRMPFFVNASLSLIAMIITFLFLIDLKPSKDHSTGELSRTEPHQETSLMAPEIPRNYLFMLYILFINAFLNGFSFGLLSSVFIIFVDEYLGFTPTQVGLLFTFGGLAGFLINYPAGKLSDKLGRKPLVVSGGYMGRFLTMLLPFLPTFQAILSVMTLRFMAMQVSVPPMRAMQADIVHPSERGKQYGRIEMFNNIGAMIGPLIGGFLYDLFHETSFNIGNLVLVGGGIPFVLSGIIGIFGVTLILLFIEETKKPAIQPSIVVPIGK